MNTPHCIPLCQAVTKFKAGQFGRDARPCRWAAGPSGFCAVHDPAIRIPQMERRAAKYSAAMVATNVELEQYRAAVEKSALDHPIP